MERLHAALFVIFLKILDSNSQNVCPVEYSQAFGMEFGRAKWHQQHKTHIQNQVVISDPPCFDDNNRLITRICINGTWNPSTTPRCQAVSPSDGHCPNYLNYVEGHCIFITEPYPWYHKRISVKDKTQIRQLEKFTKPENFWLPIRRVVTAGPFEYTDVGEDYGEPVLIPFEDYKEYLSNDCILFNATINSTQVENCANFHRHIQQFHLNYRQYNCPNGWIHGGLGVDKCYRRAKDSCESYAIINSLFDKKILEGIAQKRSCRIGEPAPSLLSAQGLVPYLNGSIWQYSQPTNNSCVICANRILNDTQVDMVLNFEEKKRQLYLLVYSYEGVMSYNYSLAVYCFTDATKDLKKKLKTRHRFSYDHIENYGKVVEYSLKVFKVDGVKKYPGQYWCEAFNLNMEIVKSNKVVAYTQKEGNEYALRVLIKDVCKHFSCTLSKFYENFIDGKLKEVFKPFNSELRLMEIFKFNVEADTLDFLLHVSTGRNASLVSEYSQCQNRSKLLLPSYMTVVYFRSSEFCLPEFTNNLTWPLTGIGRNVISSDICLSDDGRPAVRSCKGNFLYGSVWSEIVGRCTENPVISGVTEFLHQTLIAPMKNFSIQSVSEVLTSTDIDLTISDIFYLARILNKTRRLFDKISILPYVLDIIERIVDVNASVLQQSQILLNLTDTILNTIDEYLSESNFNFSFVFLVERRNFLVHVTNPFLSNISGLVLYGNKTNYTIVDMPRNSSFDDMYDPNLALATNVPELVLKQISDDPTSNTTDIFMITTIFFNDSLFVDDTSQWKPASHIVSVDIPGYGSYLESPIPILFRSKQAKKCAFWDNGRKTKEKKGRWSGLGGNYLGTINETHQLHLCSFVHLTHFALLIMSDNKNSADEDDDFLSSTDTTNEFTLTVITFIGGALSILGITAIFLTAATFEIWRKKIGTKILLNLSIAILLETLCIHLSEIDTLKQSEQGCKIIGMILHYVVLSKFFWTLIYAVLQYLRFVKVLGALPNNLVLKSVGFGWILPLVIVLLVGLTTTQSYGSSSYEICYPRGLLLYLTIILPICLIVIVNLSIFCIIMYQVSHATIKSYGGDQKTFKLQLYLAVLLFFVLGLPWIFGILAELVHSSIMKISMFYIFTITGTLQGFVLCLFYVILNKETRDHWIHFVKSKKNCLI